LSKLLFDQNISYRIVKQLKSDFSECKHISNVGLSDEEDQEIWYYAKKNDFTIVTYDSDFYEISLMRGHPPKVIWIRLGNLPTKLLSNLILKNKSFINSFLNDNSTAFLELY